MINKERGLLQEAIQHPIRVGGREMNVRRALLIHFTEGGSAASSMHHWETDPDCKEDDIGAHLIIERTGEIYQCRPFNRTISHAGKSRWQDPNTGVKYTYCNTFMIGIELANAGSHPRVIESARKLPGFAGTVEATHRNQSKPKVWEKYPEAQMKTLIRVSAELIKFYNLDDVTGHDCVAPERKEDPGPAFPMREFRAALGFSGLPIVHKI
jgi:N-acetylmuramoyl-L-alanine amidase